MLKMRICVGLLLFFVAGKAIDLVSSTYAELVVYLKSYDTTTITNFLNNSFVRSSELVRSSKFQFNLNLNLSMETRESVSAASKDIIPPSPPVQPTNSPNSSTTTTSTTPQPSPPTPPTTTTTEKTTTSSSTTTTTTTEKPSTTTTAKPTPAPTPVPPTPAPTPKPIPGSNGVWNVTETINNTNTACIVASMKVRIGVPYISHLNSTTLVNATRVIYLPDNATATGTCGNTTHQSLKLSWVESKTPVSIEFGFVQNKTTGFTLSTVNVTIPATADVFPNIAGNQTVFILVSQNTSLPPTPAAKSFKCYSGLPLTLTDATPAKNVTDATVATLNLTHVQFEAFAHATQNNFGAAVECAGDAFITPDIVPIAVGVALAALVAVVLVAYVIGRRRSNASGYLSM